MENVFIFFGSGYAATQSWMSSRSGNSPDLTLAQQIKMKTLHTPGTIYAQIVRNFQYQDGSCA